MKLHLVGLPHTQLVKETMTVCAFTSKAEKFCEMMDGLGYGIITYWGDQYDEAILKHLVEHVPCFTTDQQRQWYGDHDPNLLPMVATWNAEDPQWQTMNANVINAMRSRIEPDDLILLLAGWAQKPIADAFPGHLMAEWAAGYEGWFSPYTCFESYAWKHYCYGQRSIGDGRFYDTVIPNFFRPADFSLAETKDDYLLFVGRVTLRKGPHIAAEIAKAAGRRLLVGGAGVTEHGPGFIQGDAVRLEGDHLEYMGVLGVQERNELMGKAHALLCPTTYIEPFGAVAVEAQLTGTPAISVPWGAFTETIIPGHTGYLFSTLHEGVQAVEAVGELDPRTIQAAALARYSLESVGPRYDRWFKQIAGLRREGWYELPAKEIHIDAAPPAPDDGRRRIFA